MSIPKYFEFTRPVLRFLANNPTEHTLRQIYEAMGKEFNLTEEELALRVPGGSQTVLDNRVGWAKQDLYWAGLISRPRRGVFQINKAGLEEAKLSGVMDRNYLISKYPAVQEKFAQKKNKEGNSKFDNCESESTSTPEESIAQSYAQIKRNLSSELIENILNISPFAFEKLVIDLLQAMGYGGYENGSLVTKKSNDEGIDGIINQDKLGLDVIYLQAKRWQNDIGRKEIQSFVGALAGKHASKGIFITTSKFCKTAIDYVNNVTHKVILIDGDRLSDLMIDHDVGVNPYQTIKLKRIDSDYFENI